MTKIEGDIDAALERLVEEYSDVIPTLTRDQAEQLNAFWNDGDYESCHWYLNYLVKH